jgi:hypothetical protein
MLVYLLPDSWLEIGLHPEGPAAGQIDQAKSKFSLNAGLPVLGQMSL